MLVHENTSLTNAQKLAILRLYLDNDTRALIAYLKDTGENYDVAITQLRRRFERKDFLTNTHFKKLQRLSNVLKTENFRELRNLHNNALIHVSNLGNPRDDNPFMRQIRQILLKKLPLDMQSRWFALTKATPAGSAASASESTKTLQDLLDFINDETENWEYAPQNLATQTAALGIVEKVKVVPTKVPTAAALTATGKPVDSKKKRNKRNTKCLFCAEKHRVIDLLCFTRGKIKDCS